MKKILVLIIGILFFTNLTLVLSATPSFPSVCCEKTSTGAFCINAKPEECASGFKSAPSSCSQTSYCRTGTCYDSKEGICMENVPQLVCNSQNATWINKAIEEVPQCQLGCCIIADQAAFVSAVRCKRLSTYYGVSINFKTNINNEIDCIAAANSQDTGACVYEENYERKCKFITRAECGAPDGIVSANGTSSISTTNSSEKRFYKDYLCSAEPLAVSNCARQTQTNCYQGKVYWYDSCGNKENIYSSNLAKSWNNGKVIKDDALNPALSDGSDKNNGNCDYLQGARCAKYNLPVGGPAYGDSYCRKTECTGDAIILGGKTTRKNGESWCVYDSNVGKGLDAPGSRHFRYICIDGSVEVEPCDDYRARVCFQNDDIQTAAGIFTTAACRVNRWQDCLAQTKQEDCEDRDTRECLWIDSARGLNVGEASSSSTGNQNLGFSNPTAQVVAPITGYALFGGGDDEDEEETMVSNRASGVCVPNYPPGLQFWQKGEANSICSAVAARCVVTYKKKTLWGDMECESGCDCLSESWAAKVNNVCKSIGDCGGYVNYLGTKFTNDGYNWVSEGGEMKFSGNTQNVIISGLTGKAIGVDVVQKLGEER
jgi:hypothetical protein